MKIIAIETTTQACSAALLLDGIIKERYQWADRQHTQLLLPMLTSLLEEAGLRQTQLDAVAFCRGPGSFTGCRIGASVAQAIALATDIPVIMISSLQCLAQGAYRKFGAKQVLSAIDARMNEIYWASYQLGPCGTMAEQSAEKLSAPQQLATVNSTNFVGVGSGWDSYSDSINSLFQPPRSYRYYLQCYPRAYDVALLAGLAYQQNQFFSAEQAVPLYLRETVVYKKSQ